MNFTARVNYLGDKSCEATHGLSGLSFLTDAPPDNNGKGASFSPTDLLATALASCVMIIYSIYCERHSIDLSGAYIEVKKTMGDNPRRVAKLDLDIFLPLPLQAKGEDLWHRMALTCPVHKSLDPNLQVKHTLYFV
jgi:putative redox protein